jgi:hypothetical protein
MNFDSKTFSELPVELQYQIILDLKTRSREASSHRVQELEAAPTAVDFSLLQIRNLVHRNTLTEKLFNIAKTGGMAVNPALAKKEKENERKKQVAQKVFYKDSMGYGGGMSRRIASVKGREYILVKNDDMAGAGHTIKWVKEETGKLVEKGKLVASAADILTGMASKKRGGKSVIEIDDDGKTREVFLKDEEEESDADEEFVEVQIDDDVAASILATGGPQVDEKHSVKKDEEDDNMPLFSEDEDDQPLFSDIEDDAMKLKPAKKASLTANSQPKVLSESQPKPGKSEPLAVIDLVSEDELGPFIDDNKTVEQIEAMFAVKERELQQQQNGRTSDLTTNDAAKTTTTTDAVPDHLSGKEIMELFTAQESFEKGSTSTTIVHSQKPQTKDAFSSSSTKSNGAISTVENHLITSQTIETPAPLSDNLSMWKILSRQSFDPSSISSETLFSSWLGKAPIDLKTQIPDFDTAVQEALEEKDVETLEEVMEGLERRMQKMPESATTDGRLEATKFLWLVVRDCFWRLSDLERGKERQVMEVNIDNGVTLDGAVSVEGKTKEPDTKVGQKQVGITSVQESVSLPRIPRYFAETLQKEQKTVSEPRVDVLTSSFTPTVKQSERASTELLITSLKADPTVLEPSNPVINSVASLPKLESKIGDIGAGDVSMDDGEAQDSDSGHSAYSIANRVKCTTKIQSLDTSEDSADDSESDQPESKRRRQHYVTNNSVGDVDDEDEDEDLPSIADALMSSQQTNSHLPNLMDDTADLAVEDEDDMEGRTGIAPVESNREDEEFAKFLAQMKTTATNSYSAHGPAITANVPLTASFVDAESVQRAMKEMEAEVDRLKIKKKKDTRDAATVTSEMIQESQELLTLFGIPFLVAPMEAESQCAWLRSAGLVDGIITDDSDVFLFGGSVVYKNVFNANKYVELYSLDRMETSMGLFRPMLVLLAYLLGSDYTEGIAGIGVVTAMEILKEWGVEKVLAQYLGVWESIEDEEEGENGGAGGEATSRRRDGNERLLRCLEEFRDWVRSLQVGRKDAEDSAFRKKFRKKAKNLEIPEGFPDARVIEAYLNPQVDTDEQAFQWGTPDLEGLRDFLEDKVGFTQDKTDEIVVPVIREMVGYFFFVFIHSICRIKLLTCSNFPTTMFV